MSGRRKMKEVYKQYVNRIMPTMIELLEDELKTKKKRIWTRKWILRRSTHGASGGLLRELGSEDIRKYRSFMRMNTEVFDNLLRGIADKIQRSNTMMRDAIPARV